MNQKNLEKLFRNYIDHFEELNKQHDEKYKWVAVGHVQKKWDLEAEDLSGMIKEAFSRCYNLIDNRFVSPSNGLIKLAQYEPEVMRKLLGDLLGDDGGDLFKRQERVINFVDDCNVLMEKHFPGTWKYVQDVRSVIAYLAVIKPQENYLYKYTPAREFARYMEYGDVIGQGSDFRLSSYYNMCEQLIDHIRQCPELLEKDRNRYLYTKSNKLWKDSSLHVLAYDVIYCFDTYKLNEGMNEPATKTKSLGSQQRIYRKEQTQRIQTELEVLQDQIDELEDQIDKLVDYQFAGQILKTRAFGAVQIDRQEGKYLYFEVNGQKKQFVLPKCIIGGFLIPDNMEITQRYKTEQELTDRIKELETQQKVKYMELNKYQD